MQQYRGIEWWSRLYAKHHYKIYIRWKGQAIRLGAAVKMGYSKYSSWSARRKGVRLGKEPTKREVAHRLIDRWLDKEE